MLDALIDMPPTPLLDLSDPGELTVRKAARHLSLGEVVILLVEVDGRVFYLFVEPLEPETELAPADLGQELIEIVHPPVGTRIHLRLVAVIAVGIHQRLALLRITCP